jgi:DNA-binding transcriptional regulator YhcF (GntR family)
MTDAPLVVLDAQSPVPPFEQVRSRLASAIAAGAIAPETRLPPIRTLAAELGLAANTVARSYRELEEAGLVETRGRNGTFVVGTPTESRQAAAALTRDYLAAMTELGINPAEVTAMVRHELER